MKIKWRGYPLEEATWESFKTFSEDAPELMHKYWLDQCHKYDLLQDERNQLLYRVQEMSG